MALLARRHCDSDASCSLLGRGHNKTSHDRAATGANAEETPALAHLLLAALGELTARTVCLRARARRALKLPNAQRVACPEELGKLTAVLMELKTSVDTGRHEDRELMRWLWGGFREQEGFALRHEVWCKLVGFQVRPSPARRQSACQGASSTAHVRLASRAAADRKTADDRGPGTHSLSACRRAPTLAPICARGG